MAAAPSASGPVELSMPVGAYLRFEVTAPCGLASETAILGQLDDPLSFYHPEHERAGLLWFHQGFVEYAFRNPLPSGGSPVSLELTFEACSDAPGHDNTLQSDITLWINDREVGTWTSPGDFGGERGVRTPGWWSTQDSQLGLLKRWRVDDRGSFLDDEPVSALRIGDLALPGQRFVIVGLGVKADAAHVGGMNLFGSSFGNHPQDIELRLAYST